MKLVSLLSWLIAAVALGLVAWLSPCASAQPEAPPAEVAAAEKSPPVDAKAPAEPIWELQPYRLGLLLAVDAKAHLPADAAAAIERRLRQLTDNLVGARWEWTQIAAPAPQLRHKLLTVFGDVQLTELPAALAQADKVLVVAVDEQQGVFRVRAREWDTAARQGSTVVERIATTAGQLPDQAFRAVAEAFSPLALIETVQGSKVALRLRGGELPLRDASRRWVSKGSVFRPVVRRLDSLGRTERDEVAAIPWTFLLVQDAGPSALSAQLHSGIRSPLSTSRRGRMQQLALAVGKPAGQTTLALVSADGQARPLEGYDVLIRNPDETTPRWIGRTDYRGQVAVPAGTHPLQILSVKHGEQLLARLPCSPGLTPRESAELVDDDARLEAEGWVAAVQETLVDAVTRRSLLVAQIDARLKAGDNDQARRLLDELRRMPSRQQLLFEVEQQQQRLTANQPQVARQLERMFGDTKKIVAQHLDPRVIDELELRLSRGRVAASPQPTNANR